MDESKRRLDEAKSRHNAVIKPGVGVKFKGRTYGHAI